MQQTYGGVFRELAILPFPVSSSSTLSRGQVCEWDAGTQTARAWTAGTNVPLGVCTGDVDRDLQQVAVYVGKGASVLVKCDTDIVPNVNDFLFYSSPGVVSNMGTAGQAFARAIGVGFNEYVEAIIV
jgi:hypothetical protein